ncbi:hypothetical protein JOM56_012066 [Amanita muscaria]
MKSFKVLMLLTLAAALSCGSPVTNATATGVSNERRNRQELFVLVNDLQGRLVNQVWKRANGDKKVFTQTLVNALTNESPHYNYVICLSNPKNVYHFRGTQDVDWTTLSLEARDHSFNYDLFIVGAGRFTRGVPGGYENWAWNAVVPKTQDTHSNIVTLLDPATGSHRLGGGY